MHGSVFRLWLVLNLYWWSVLRTTSGCNIQFNPLNHAHENSCTKTIQKLTVDVHPSFLMEPWVTRTQLWGQRYTIIGLLWRESWQQYAEKIEDGASLTSAGHTQVQYIVCIFAQGLIMCIYSTRLCSAANRLCWLLKSRIYTVVKQVLKTHWEASHKVGCLYYNAITRM